MNTTLLLKLAALTYLGLLAAGILMPRVVGLGEHIRKLPKFVRQLFWVYYSFIGLCLISFGLGTFFLADELASGTPLARSACGFFGVFLDCAVHRRKLRLRCASLSDQQVATHRIARRQSGFHGSAPCLRLGCLKRRPPMIAIHEVRRSFWLRLKMLLTIGHVITPNHPATQPDSKPKRRSHRTTAFFEIP